jgi:hypothetical protein
MPRGAGQVIPQKNMYQSKCSCCCSERYRRSGIMRCEVVVHTEGETRYQKTVSRLDKQPSLVVEELDPKYCRSLNKTSLKEPLRRSHRPFIKRVHVVQFGEFGCYVGKIFGRNPHYMIPFEQYEITVQRPCLLFDIVMVVYPMSKTITHL